MKTFSAIIIVLFIGTYGYSQSSLTGIYISNEQRFENDNEPRKNTHRFQNLLIEVDISEITNMGYLKVIFPQDNLSMKWDITSKTNMKFNEEQKTLYTVYDGYLNIENYRTNTRFTIVFVKDYSSTVSSLHVVVQGTEWSRTWYDNLKKKD